jgi:polysaccharide biosynthesis transport protein
MKDETSSLGARLDPYGPSLGSGSNGASARTVGIGDGVVQRGFRDYVLILRERIWYIVIVFLSVFLASLVYTLSSTKVYTAASTIEVLARDPVVMKVQEVRDSDLRGPEDLNTQVKILESSAIVQMVAAGLSPDDTKALMAPYDRGDSTESVVPEDVLSKNRRIIPTRMTRILQVVYTHPDPDVAAKIANLFVEEFMNYNARWRVDESMKAVEDLKVRADQQGKKVQELGNGLQAYRERQNMISLDQRKDIVTEKLKAVSLLLTQANSHLSEADVRWKQVQECLKSNGNLANLTFIASSPIVQSLVQEVGTKTIEVGDLQQRYRSEHPKMIEATLSLEQTRSELAHALDDAAARIHNEYETALRDYEQAKTDLANQEAEALRLDRYSVDYGSLQNELTVNEQLLASIVTRMRETSMNASIESHNARVVDRAVRPRHYSSPKIGLNLGMGAMGGLACGLGLAFFVAFIDDRVKSAFQIESVIGLPLIGIIPRMRKVGPGIRAKGSISESDPLVAEAFLTLHSNLRLNPAFKGKKVILVTSTTPSEGKTFVTTHLALTFADHGERTIVVDCDMRKPNLHKSFSIENLKGVIDYCASGTRVDDLIVKGPRENLDVLPAGGRAMNPTQILNHESFGRLIGELRERYDRVFIDTPPLAPVSDAKIILPNVDGSIFAIRFNHVRTKGAKLCAKWLLDSNVPCFGAVLNSLDLALSEYYYAEYYDKSYKDYIRAPSAEQTEKS